MRPTGTATTAPAPITGLPPDLQAAIAGVRAAIRHQIDIGQLDPYAGAALLRKVNQVARELSERDWTAAFSTGAQMWEMLDTYRKDGRLTSTGYQAIVATLEKVHDVLTNR